MKIALLYILAASLLSACSNNDPDKFFNANSRNNPNDSGSGVVSSSASSSGSGSSTNTLFVGYQYVTTIFSNSSNINVSTNIVTNPIAVGSSCNSNIISTNLMTIYTISNYVSNSYVLFSQTNITYSNNTTSNLVSYSFIPGFMTTSGYQNAVDIGNGHTNIANTSIPIEGTIVLLVNDPTGDDDGGGTITYPVAYSPGMFDIHQFVMSADSSYLYFYVAMRTRSCIQVSSNQNASGFYGLFLGTYFGKLQTPTGSDSYLGTTSPNDGNYWCSNNWLSPGFQTTNVSIQYSACVIGSTSPNIGVVTASTNFFTKGTNGYNMFITTNDIIPTGNTVYAWRIARGTQFTSGDWLFTAFSYSWEDYGLSTSCPGVNGFLRPINENASSYIFGCGSTAYSSFPRCIDILSTNGNQPNLLAPGISTNRMWDTDFIPVILP